jgi:hypothetical protein
MYLEYVLDLLSSIFKPSMPARKSTPRRKQPVKRLLDEVLPTKSLQPKGKVAAVAAAAAEAAVKRLVDKGTQAQPSNETATSSTSTSKPREEVKQGQGMLSAPALLSQQSSSRLQASEEVR